MLQRLFAMAGIVLAFAAPAHGALVTFAFEGTVYDVPGELAESFHSGDHVTGSITFDSDTAQASELFPGSPRMGAYQGAIKSLTVQIGTYAGGNHSSEGTGIVVVTADRRRGDSFVAHSPFQGPNVGPFSSNLRPDSNTFTLELEDPSASTLESDALPVSPPAQFSAFPGSSMRLFFSDGVHIRSIAMAVTKVRSDLAAAVTDQSLWRRSSAR
jgi:hypothetical protein